ncbi:MAG: hypothetical protein ACI841_003429 [Planctomycetota bacterium]|jgi:hypothetical protein
MLAWSEPQSNDASLPASVLPSPIQRVALTAESAMQPSEEHETDASSNAIQACPAQGVSVDPLIALLLPVLLHKLNNATQLLTGVHALMQLAPEEDSLTRHGEDLAHTSRKVDDLGWLLALVASIGGANLMLDRREERGLDLLLGLLSDALRRDGVRLSPSESGRRMSPSVQCGWQLPWAVGAFLNAAARDLIDKRPPPEGCFEQLDWSMTSGDLETRFAVVGGAHVRELEPRLRDRFTQDADDSWRIEWDGSRAELVLPIKLLPRTHPPLEA